ncbi:MAG: Golgi transport complex subunit 6 [Alyxoria varia]|nr:MAG: Golgi transport complex subunit 6 [Alyxoria varia]
MASLDKVAQSEGAGSPLSASTSLPGPRGSQLSSKISSVLSTSFADLEIRDALNTLDERGIKNDADTRRNLRLEVQKEIIQCNADVIDDFGHVAQQLKSVGQALTQLQNTCASMRKHVTAARVETAPIIDEANTLVTQRSQVQTKQSLLAAFKDHFILTDAEITILTSTAEAPIDDAFFATLVKTKTIQKDCDVLLGGENHRLGLEILDQSSKHLNAAFTKLYRYVQRELKGQGGLEDLESAVQLSSGIRRGLRVLAERPTLFQSCLDAFAATRERLLSDGFYEALTGATTSTGRGPGDKGQKPIEFSAHEPLRYVGDMLAWVHATAVSEQEALEVLFVAEGNEIAKGIQAGLESEPWSRPEGDEPFDGRRALGQLVDRSLAGVAQQLQQRVEQVVSSQGGTSGAADRGADDEDEDATPEEPSLLYRICNLVVFYRRIFMKMLPHDNDFTRTLEDLQSPALDQFLNVMHQRLILVQSDVANFTTLPEELQHPDFLDEALDVFKSLLRSYDASSAPSINNPTKDLEGPTAQLKLLYDNALDPFLSCCERIAIKAKSTPDESQASLDRHCFSVNCLLAAKAVLAEFPSYTQEKNIELDAHIREHAEELVGLQYAWLLSASGLQPLVSALASLRKKHGAQPVQDSESDTSSSASESDDDDEPRGTEIAAQHILAHPAFARSSLHDARTTLDNFLPSALTDALERLGKHRLRNSSLAKEVTARAVRRFRRDFERVERAVLEGSAKQVEMKEDEDGGEEEDDGEEETLRDIFPRTAEEIGILLS